MTFVIGLLIGVWIGASAGVIIAGLFASSARRESQEIYQLRPKPGRDKGGHTAA